MTYFDAYNIYNSSSMSLPDVVSLYNNLFNSTDCACQCSHCGLINTSNGGVAASASIANDNQTILLQCLTCNGGDIRMQ